MTVDFTTAHLRTTLRAADAQVHRNVPRARDVRSQIPFKTIMAALIAASVAVFCFVG